RSPAESRTIPASWSNEVSKLSGGGKKRAGLSNVKRPTVGTSASVNENPRSPAPSLQPMHVPSVVIVPYPEKPGNLNVMSYKVSADAAIGRTLRLNSKTADRIY